MKIVLLKNLNFQSSANGVYKGTRPKAQKGKKRHFDFTD
jgi:hypothetical protein